MELADQQVSDIRELSDDDLVFHWVRAMACFIGTKAPEWESLVSRCDEELFHRKLGRRRLNVKMAA